MNIEKLSRYLSGELPNTKQIPIAEFVSICKNNRGISDKELNKYEHRVGSLSKDFEDLLNIIKSLDEGDGKIFKIVEGLGLDIDFIGIPDFSKYSFELSKNTEHLIQQKRDMLLKIEVLLKELSDKAPKKGMAKSNGNKFEDICEEFLLNSSYFEPGFKELPFEDKTGKIDRLLKLKKDIGNFNKKTEFLGYVILESKYKLKDKNSASEVSQLKEYIERLNKYGIARYAIVITSTGFKSTYKTKLGDSLQQRVIDNNPFYISILTIEEIKKFLENKGEYENMSFDEFIERSFIKRLK